MDVRQALENRRAVKRFDPEVRLQPQEIDELLSLARLAPSAFNLQHCRFVIPEDPQLRQRLRAVSFDQSQVTDASLLVIFCADLQAWRNDAEACWQHLPAEARASVVGMIEQFYTGRDQLQRDEGIRSCALAAMALMLAAQQLGYDSCPMDGFDPEAVGALIGLPADHVVCMYVAVGKAQAPAPPRGGKLPASRTIIRNGFAAG